MKYYSLIQYVIWLTFFSCQSHYPFSKKYQAPIVSIDSIFHEVGIPNGEFHARRLTNAIAVVLDSISKDNTLKFAANYRLHQPIKSSYSLSAKLMPIQVEGQKEMKWMIQGFLTNNNTKEKTEDFSCFGPTLDICFAYDPMKTDSTNYKLITRLISYGFYLQNLVPLRSILEPKNIENKGIKYFSLNSYITSSRKDKKKAMILTHIINNILVFNQSSHDRAVIKNYMEFNYLNNYRRDDKLNGNFNIRAELKRKKKNLYALNFTFEGKDINLIAPERLSTNLEFRISKGDYTEAVLTISPLILQFVNMNRIFD